MFQKSTMRSTSSLPLWGRKEPHLLDQLDHAATLGRQRLGPPTVVYMTEAGGQMPFDMLAVVRIDTQSLEAAHGPPHRVLKALEALVPILEKHGMDDAHGG